MNPLSLEVSGPDADYFTLVMLAMALAVTVFMACRQWIQLAFTGWVVVICFVPIWFSISFGFEFSLATVGAAAVLSACLPVVPRRIGLADWGIALLFAALLLPYVIGAATLASLVVVSQWAVAFLLGRLIAYRVSLDTLFRLLAIIFTVVAILAIVEFVLSWNPFVELATSSPAYGRWSPLQERGGVIRAEGAFGHSIALGACIALVTPIVLSTSFHPSVRLSMVVVLIGATVVTFSRIGMLCALLSVVLCVTFIHQGMSRRMRALIASTITILGILVVPLITETFSAAGDEASGSAAYRGDLFSLIPAMQPFGIASNVSTTPSGEVYFGNFQSIDSALILLGLTYGWIPLIIAIGLVIAAICLMVTRRASPVMIAAVAQIPAVLSVALINQYAVFLWFMIGLAVYTRSAQLEPRAGGSRRQTSPGMRATV